MAPIFIAVLFLVFLIWVFRGRLGASGPIRLASRCRWVSTGQGSGSLTQFRCKTCKAVAYSAERNGPVQCKKDFDGGGL